MQRNITSFNQVIVVFALLVIALSSTVLTSCRKASNKQQAFPNVNSIDLNDIEVDAQAKSFVEQLAAKICQPDGAAVFLGEFGDTDFHQVMNLPPDAPYPPMTIADINTGERLLYEYESDSDSKASSVTTYADKPDYRIVLTPEWCARKSGSNIEQIIAAMKQLVRLNDGEAKQHTSKDGELTTLTTLYRTTINDVELTFVEKQHLEGEEQVDSLVAAFLIEYKPEP